jgi:chromosome segregation ATPase
MFKKLILAAGLLAAGTMLITKTHIGAYGRAMAGWAKNTVVGNIPLEADIMAAKQLLADMDGKIENAARTVARERVEVRKLDEQFAKRDADMKAKKDQIVGMKKGLEANLTAFNPAEQALQRARLVNLFTAYETLEAQQKSEYKLLESRRMGLVSSELKVEKLKSAQRELKGKIEALDARRKLMEAEKISAVVEVDDSEIADLKNLVNNIEKKLDVEAETEKELESIKTGNPVTPPAPSAQEVMKQIDEKFGPAKTSGNGARI